MSERESGIRLSSLCANRRTFRYLVILRGWITEKCLRAKHVTKDKRDSIRGEICESRRKFKLTKAQTYIHARPYFESSLIAERYINYRARVTLAQLSIARATLNYKTDKFIPWDTGQTSGIPRLINEPLIPTSCLTRPSTGHPPCPLFA